MTGRFIGRDMERKTKYVIQLRVKVRSGQTVWVGRPRLV